MGCPPLLLWGSLCVSYLPKGHATQLSFQCGLTGKQVLLCRVCMGTDRSLHAPSPKGSRCLGVPVSLAWRAAKVGHRAQGRASWKYSSFYMEIMLDLTEGLSSHFTGEDIEAQSCQQVSES